MQNAKFESLRAKLKLMGAEETTFVGCSKDKEIINCSILSVKNNNYVNIPDNVCMCMDPNELHTYNNNFKYAIEKIQGHNKNIKLFGGKGLESMSHFFQNSTFDTIDLSEFDTSNVKEMEFTFHSCKTNKLIGLDKLKDKVQNIRSLHCTFNNCRTILIDLSDWQLLNCEDMSSIFEESNITGIKLDKIKTPKLIYLINAFKHCRTLSLDLRDLDLHRVVSFEKLFCACQISNISMTGVNCDSVENIREMCSGAEIDHLCMGNITMKLYDMRLAFNNAIIPRLTLPYITNLSEMQINAQDAFRNLRTNSPVNLKGITEIDMNHSQSMFRSLEAPVLAIPNIKFCTERYDYSMNDMFTNCEAKIYTNLDTINRVKKIKGEHYISNLDIYWYDNNKCIKYGGT